MKPSQTLLKNSPRLDAALDVDSLREQLSRYMAALNVAEESKQYIEDQKADLPLEYIDPDKHADYIARNFELMGNIEEEALDIESIKAHVKEMVIALGETYNAYGFEAVYVRGRVKWDTKHLNKAVEFHPWLNECRSFGDDYVAIKKSK